MPFTDEPGWPVYVLFSFMAHSSNSNSIARVSISTRYPFLPSSLTVADRALHPSFIPHMPFSLTLFVHHCIVAYPLTFSCLSPPICRYSPEPAPPDTHAHIWHLPLVRPCPNPRRCSPSCAPQTCRASSPWRIHWQRPQGIRPASGRRAARAQAAPPCR